MLEREEVLVFGEGLDLAKEVRQVTLLKVAVEGLVVPSRSGIRREVQDIRQVISAMEGVRLGVQCNGLEVQYRRDEDDAIEV